MITAHGSIPDAVHAAQLGVHSFLTKPLDKTDLIEKVHDALARAGHHGNDLTAGVDALGQRFGTRNARLSDLVEQARRVSDSNVNILILGESGTGKEVLAHAIHDTSKRCDAPFIAVNCAAIPDTLLESELFGHRKGAFTGANEHRDGFFKQADGGTLFLDEIGDMPIALQAKLLRALQERTVRPIGSQADIHVDVRIISATHCDLNEKIQAQQFRSDLLYRLNVVTLSIPSLNERREDIASMSQHFLKEIAEREQKEVTAFSPDALDSLTTAHWPGNVRQLKNVVERCVVLAAAPVIPQALVEQAISGKHDEVLPLSDAKASFEKDYLERLLQLTQGNVADAATIAKRNRTQFYKLLAKHDISY